MTWLYQGVEQTEAPTDYQGFVYLIEDLHNDRLYIGKKNYWTTQKLPPLKGKTRRRHRRVETDWHEYWGSSAKLNEQIALHGPVNFRRTILKQCITKTDMAYWETKTQFDLNVLLDSRYYNEMINCRITARGIRF